MPQIIIRPAQPADIPAVYGFLKSHAALEGAGSEMKMTEADVRTAAFGPKPGIEILVAEVEGVVRGHAVFYDNFSTWTGRHGLFLDDIYVDPSQQKLGLGRRLMAGLAQLCQERGWPRLDFVVQRDNAARGFYEKLGFNHVEPWLLYRASGTALEELAKAEEA